MFVDGDPDGGALGGEDRSVRGEAHRDDRGGDEDGRVGGVRD